MPKVPAIPEDAPFTTAQRIWLNGFLAGLFAQTDHSNRATDATAQPTKPVLILFGSQTGTAEALARRVATEARNRGFVPRVMEANAAAKVEWSAETRLLIVTSTYGDGDAPDNAQTFCNWLKTDAAKALSHVQYAVLALGDSHYEHFCAAGKRIDARLEELGARRVFPRTDCDVDYAIPANAWSQGALAALEADSSLVSRIAQPPTPQLELETKSVSSNNAGFSRQNPFSAALWTNRRLTAEGSAKEVRHFEISLEGSDLAYEAGDALGVQPTNCPSLVEELLRRLRCDGEEAVPVPRGGEVSLRKALSDFYEISKPGQDFLQRLADLNPSLHALLSDGSDEALKKWLWGREVIDLLLGTPNFHPTVPEFISLLKPLAPRLYSISSSPKVHTGQVHLTVSIVRYESHGRAHKGVCSTFLADRASGRVPVPVFVQKSAGFRLPASADTPIIMVGPGTGVAPFRAFLHERQATGAKGPNWLFFGEQHAATDFYYRDELEAMLSSNHLTRLSTAFSRDQADKLYVQDRMREEAAGLWSWLQEGAHFYVCGDASRMARDVDNALHQVIQAAGQKTAEQAAEFVDQLKATKRYQRDVY